MTEHTNRIKVYYKIYSAVSLIMLSNLISSLVMQKRKQSAGSDSKRRIPKLD